MCNVSSWFMLCWLCWYPFCWNLDTSLYPYQRNLRQLNLDHNNYVHFDMVTLADNTVQFICTFLFSDCWVICTKFFVFNCSFFESILLLANRILRSGCALTTLSHFSAHTEMYKPGWREGDVKQGYRGCGPLGILGTESNPTGWLAYYVSHMIIAWCNWMHGHACCCVVL